MKTPLNLRIELWKEGDSYVAYLGALDLSSCGSSLDEVKKNIQEAVECFLEEASRMGTLNDILEESGFVFDNEWKSPEHISTEIMRIEV